MTDVGSVVRWWEDWQLRILVLGSLFLQWFLVLFAPLRKYTIPRILRTCIWLAYISSDALAIYALATLFNRHARASTTGMSCDGFGSDGSKHSSRILEVLWAPALLIHLGGQQELAGYEIEDNELWTRHTVTLVSQVAVALYAFYKSWPCYSDWKLLAAAVLLFVVGVVSLSEKPWALNKAKIKRPASLWALIQGTKKSFKWTECLHRFLLFEESNCFTGGLLSCWKEDAAKQVFALTEGDKIQMALSDMPLLAAATDLVDWGKVTKIEDVLPPLLIAENAMPRYLRYIFTSIYTRATVVGTLPYLLYHVLVVPTLHIAALKLFATCDKQLYKRADVKITYIVLCLTAALDVLAVFIRLLLDWLMSMTRVPGLCETVPGYNIINAALQESKMVIGLMYRCARRVGFNCEEYFGGCKPELGELYRKVSQTVLADLVHAQGREARDLASYRIFSKDHSTADRRERPGKSSSNWVLSKELQWRCGVEIRKCLGTVPFDRSVLLWHIATDLCFRCIVIVEDVQEEGELQQEELCQEVEEEGEGEGGGAELISVTRMRDQYLRLLMDCAHAISNYMAHLLNLKPEMLLTGSREHLISEAMEEIKGYFSKEEDKLSKPDKLKELIFRIAEENVSAGPTFHIIQACKVAKELLEIPEESTRWMLMYRVWLGMLCYSASMCRGYLHAKSLGEGGEFLSVVWVVLSLKGAKTLADMLQMPPETQASDKAETETLSVEIL